MKVDKAAKEREAVVNWHREQARRLRDEARRIGETVKSGTELMLKTGHLANMASWHDACEGAIERGDHLKA
jgi:hypothetical protein